VVTTDDDHVGTETATTRPTPDPAAPDPAPADPAPPGPAPESAGPGVADAERAALRERLAVTGTWVLRASWWSTAVFTASAVPATFGVEVLEDVGLVVAVALFALSLVVWVDGFARAAARTTRGDDVSVANLYFLQGSAPRRIQRHLFGSLLAATVVAFATAAWAPFGILVPSLQLALVGEWAARYGVFPPRPPAPVRRVIPPRPPDKRR
jgi:hypothetical protein